MSTFDTLTLKDDERIQKQFVGVLRGKVLEIVTQ